MEGLHIRGCEEEVGWGVLLDGFGLLRRQGLEHGLEREQECNNCVKFKCLTSEKDNIFRVPAGKWIKEH